MGDAEMERGVKTTYFFQCAYFLPSFVPSSLPSIFLVFLFFFLTESQVIGGFLEVEK